MSEAVYAGAGRTPVLDPLRHVYWGAIFLGLVIAVAIQILLGLLGIAIGLGSYDPTARAGLGALGSGAAIWLIGTQIVALSIGGYAAARMSSAVGYQSAIFHSGAIWAASTILAFWFGTSALGTVVSGLSGALSDLGKATGQAVQAALPEDFNLNLPNIGWDSLPDPVKQSLQQRGITPDNFQNAVQDAYRQVISPEEQRQIAQQLKQAALNILKSPTNAPEDIRRTVDRIFGAGGILGQEDIRQLKRVLQNRLNLSDEEVQQIMNGLEQGVAQLRQSAVQAIQNAREQALQAAEEASDRVAAIAFWTFFASLLGLIFALIGGWVGQATKRRRRTA